MRYLKSILMTLMLSCALTSVYAKSDEMKHDGSQGEERIYADLDLTEQQKTELEKIRATQRDSVKSLALRHQQTMTKLEEQVNKKAPDAELKPTLDELKSIQKAMMDQRLQFQNQKDDLLTPTQYAKLLLKQKHMMEKHRGGMMMQGKKH